MSHMGARTYIPMLLWIAHRFCKYVAKYQPQLNGHLTDPQKVLLNTAVEACLALTASIGELPVDD